MDTPPIPTPTTSSQSSMETPPVVTETPQPQPQPQSQPPPQPPPQPQPQPLPQPTPQPLEPPSSSSQTQHSQPFQTPHTISSSSSPIPIPIPTPTPNPNPNLNPNPNPIPTNFPQQPPANSNISNRPPFNRPWSQPTSQFSHFPSQFHSSSASSTSTSTSSPVVPPPQRGGIAIGVPASSVSSQPSSFSSSFGAHYVGPPASSPSPARPSIHGMPSMGMIGSQLRPGGVPPSALLQQRPVQAASGIRPQPASNSLPSASQNFQGHGMLRAPSVSASSISTPSTSQSQQSPHQPWLSAQHGRPPLPSQSVRPQVNPQSLQQRSHIPQQSPQLLQEASPPHQLLPSSQQPHQIPASNQSQDNHGQQLSSARISQPLANQQQLIRAQGSTNQKPPSPAIGQASIVPSGRPTENSNATEISEACSTILSKRNIQEIVNQIDPSEKLDPEVEDVLVDIAEEFIDSITTFGCSLAKHRKSSTLEAKDILLHIDRTWNMTLPGFSGDEIRTYKKPVVNDIHKERLALIKKSHTGAEIGTNKTSAGPATVNVKGNFTKAAANVVGS